MTDVTDRGRARPDPRLPVVSGFPADVATELVAAIDDVNEQYHDTMLLLTALVEDVGSPVAAWVASVDPSGADIALQLPDGATIHRRLTFDATTRSLDQVHGQLHAMVARARDTADATVPTTSLERELASLRRLRTFVTEVVDVRDLTPSLRQITVRGGLDGFAPLAADQFLSVVVPHAPHVAIDDAVTMERRTELTEDDRPAAAYYTVRRWRPSEGELDLWFVVGHHDGPVGDWAARARPGARIALWGPRASYRPPGGTTSLLLVGDETALAAIAAILDERAPKVPAQVVVEVGDRDQRVDLPAGDGVTTHWVFRGADPPGTGTRLVDAVRHLELDVDGCYAFGGAESRQIAAVRAHLRRDRHLPADRVRMTGYWRRAT